MNSNQSILTNDQVINLSKRHTWAATGVSDYPPRDPLVGQSRFFKRYRTFIHTVDQDADHFAHVFAVEAEWGRGKSRLGHELIAQINSIRLSKLRQLVWLWSLQSAVAAGDWQF